MFTKNDQPNYFANVFLNNQDLFSLLNMNTTELKQELATGKSVVEFASSKNISTQGVRMHKKKCSLKEEKQKKRLKNIIKVSNFYRLSKKTDYTNGFVCLPFK
ncbi:hypothetical protein ACIQ1D_02525 [Lysinibacillus xylanilyticus]|uniref:hypothetical protein n=1 Tax=Lysinibacillus xylanilyticus TaxID=582475 RepID=UPI0038253C43